MNVVESKENVYYVVQKRAFGVSLSVLHIVVQIMKTVCGLFFPRKMLGYNSCGETIISYINTYHHL